MVPYNIIRWGPSLLAKEQGRVSFLTQKVVTLQSKLMRMG